MILAFIGTTELLLIGGLALLLVGGKKLPEMMRGLGKGVRGIQRRMKETTDDETPSNQQSQPKESESNIYDDSEQSK